MANNISVLDSAAAAQVVKTTDTASVHTPHQNVDAVIPGTGATNLGKAIDTAAGATDTGVGALAVRDDALGALTPAEGDWVALRTDANGALWVHDDALDAAISGSELQVDVVAALPAGTNAIGKLAANSGVDIGDVDVTSVTPGTTASALGKAEDAAHSSGDVGVMALAVRSDAQTVTGADGDYVPLLVNSSGALYVTGGGGGTEYTEDAAAAANPVGTTLILIREDGRAGGLTTTDGDNVAARGNNKGELYVKTTDADALLTTIDADTSALFGCVGGTELQVDVVGALPAGTNAIGKLAANSGVDIGDVDVTSIVPGTGATNLGKAIDTATGATDTGVLALATRDDELSGLTPAEGDCVQLRTDANGALWCVVSGTVTVASHAVTNAGTFAVQVDGSALTALQLIDDVIFTDDAAFTPGTSKVAVIGAQADEGSTDSVDEGDAGALRMTLDRKLHVAAELESNSMRAGGTSVTPKFAVIDAATSGDNTIVAANATKKLRVTSLFLVASGAVTVRFEGGAGGTALTGQMNLAANGGFVLPYNPNGWFETASNTLLNLELSGATSVDGALTYIEV